ncbi:MAG: hypothetical protein ACI9BD_000786 [Candidatus Marinamargulisbacteria bacterium]|jgi:hypothetical protein
MAKAPSFDLDPEIMYRSCNFFVFEPSSLRVHKADVLLRGEEVVEFYEKLAAAVEKQEPTLKIQTLQHKIAKIGQMLKLLKSFDNVIITRFFDKVWRRYAYITNLGENFLDLNTFLTYFPEYNAKQDIVIANRFDAVEEDDFPVTAEEVAAGSDSPDKTGSDDKEEAGSDDTEKAEGTSDKDAAAKDEKAPEITA